MSRPIYRTPEGRYVDANGRPVDPPEGSAEGSAEVSTETSDPSTDSASTDSPPSEPWDSDDLTLVSGVGPGLAKRLRELGFFQVSHLATIADDDLDRLAAEIKGATVDGLRRFRGHARGLVERGRA